MKIKLNTARELGPEHIRLCLFLGQGFIRKMQLNATKHKDFRLAAAYKDIYKVAVQHPPLKHSLNR